MVVLPLAGVCGRWGRRRRACGSCRASRRAATCAVRVAARADGGGGSPEASNGPASLNFVIKFSSCRPSRELHGPRDRGPPVSQIYEAYGSRISPTPGLGRGVPRRGPVQWCRIVPVELVQSSKLSDVPKSVSGSALTRAKQLEGPRTLRAQARRSSAIPPLFGFDAPDELCQDFCRRPCATRRGSSDSKGSAMGLKFTCAVKPGPGTSRTSTSGTGGAYGPHRHGDAGAARRGLFGNCPRARLPALDSWLISSSGGLQLFLPLRRALGGWAP